MDNGKRQQFLMRSCFLVLSLQAVVISSQISSIAFGQTRFRPAGSRLSLASRLKPSSFQRASLAGSRIRSGLLTSRRKQLQQLQQRRVIDLRKGSSRLASLGRSEQLLRGQSGQLSRQAVGVDRFGRRVLVRLPAGTSSSVLSRLQNQRKQQQARQLLSSREQARLSKQTGTRTSDSLGARQSSQPLGHSQHSSTSLSHNDHHHRSPQAQEAQPAHKQSAVHHHHSSEQSVSYQQASPQSPGQQSSVGHQHRSSLGSSHSMDPQQHGIRDHHQPHLQPTSAQELRHHQQHLHEVPHAPQLHPGSVQQLVPLQQQQQQPEVPELGTRQTHLPELSLPRQDSRDHQGLQTAGTGAVLSSDQSAGVHRIEQHPLQHHEHLHDQEQQHVQQAPQQMIVHDHPGPQPSAAPGHSHHHPHGLSQPAAHTLPGQGQSVVGQGQGQGQASGSQQQPQYEQVLYVDSDGKVLRQVLQPRATATGAASASSPSQAHAAGAHVQVGGGSPQSLHETSAQQPLFAHPTQTFQDPQPVHQQAVQTHPTQGHHTVQAGAPANQAGVASQLGPAQAGVHVAGSASGHGHGHAGASPHGHHPSGSAQLTPPQHAVHGAQPVPAPSHHHVVHSTAAHAGVHQGHGHVMQAGGAVSGGVAVQGGGMVGGTGATGVGVSGMRVPFNPSELDYVPVNLPGGQTVLYGIRK